MTLVEALAVADRPDLADVDELYAALRVMAAELLRNGRVARHPTTFVEIPVPW